MRDGVDDVVEDFFDVMLFEVGLGDVLDGAVRRSFH